MGETNFFLSLRKYSFFSLVGRKACSGQKWAARVPVLGSPDLPHRVAMAWPSRCTAVCGRSRRCAPLRSLARSIGSKLVRDRHHVIVTVAAASEDLVLASSSSSSSSSPPL